MGTHAVPDWHLASIIFYHYNWYVLTSCDVIADQYLKLLVLTGYRRTNRILYALVYNFYVP